MAGFSQIETCWPLSLVKGSRVHPSQRSRSRSPASWAIRSSSAGHTYRNGIDQYSPENPHAETLRAAYEKRYGGQPPMWPNAIPVLAYDTARVLIEGLFRAPILSGPGLKAGLETIRFMPSTTGGAQTHIACSPYEHGMFRGDWLLYGKVVDGKLEFEGLFEPWED